MVNSEHTPRTLTLPYARQGKVPFDPFNCDFPPTGPIRGEIEIPQKVVLTQYRCSPFTNPDFALRVTGGKGVNTPPLTGVHQVFTPADLTLAVVAYVLLLTSPYLYAVLTRGRRRRKRSPR